jgi:hypothetical protein
LEKSDVDIGISNTVALRALHPRQNKERRITYYFSGGAAGSGSGDALAALGFEDSFFIGPDAGAVCWTPWQAAACSVLVLRT